MRDFSFQGRIYLGTRLLNGQPDKLVWVGDQSSCELGMSTENADRTETYSGQRLQSARLRTATTVDLSLVLRYFNAYNVQLGLYATPYNVASSTVSDEALPDDTQVGDRVVLAKGVNVSNLAIKDSLNADLTAGTHYRQDARNGSVIEILNLSGFTPPLKATYDHAAFTALPLFTADPPERYLLLDGINTVDGKRVRVHLYRCQFNPVEGLGLIHDEFGELPVSGTVLFDPEMSQFETIEGESVDIYGGFGRMEIPQEESGS